MYGASKPEVIVAFSPFAQSCLHAESQEDLGPDYFYESFCISAGSCEFPR